MKHIIDIAFYSEEMANSLDELLQKHRGTWEHYSYLPETIKVSVIKFANFTERKQVGNLDILVQPLPSLLLLAPFLSTLLAKVEPDLIITHSLKYPIQTRMLQVFASNSCKVAVQLHADSLNKTWIKRKIQSICFKNINYLLVSGQSLAVAFTAAGIFSRSCKVIEVMEGSCDFVQRETSTVAERSSLKLIWVGRFTPGKDIGTLLQACKLLDEQKIGYQLTIVSSGGVLEKQVNLRIDELQLRKNLRIISNVAHAAMQDLFWQADIFISTSLHEGSGWSLCEAMACGLTTVVSDIPSHRWMTKNGEAGGLFTCGNAAQLVECIKKYNDGGGLVSSVSRNIFNERLSFQSIAKTISGLI